MIREVRREEIPACVRVIRSIFCVNCCAFYCIKGGEQNDRQRTGIENTCL